MTDTDLRAAIEARVRVSAWLDVNWKYVSDDLYRDLRTILAAHPAPDEASDYEKAYNDLRAALEALADECEKAIQYSKDAGWGAEFDRGYNAAVRFIKNRLTRLLASLAPEAATEHDCDTCADCIHDGHRCCGCYDGVCCRDSVFAPAVPAGGEDGHHPNCFQSRGNIPDDLPADLCDCRVLRMLDASAPADGARDAGRLSEEEAARIEAAEDDDTVAAVESILSARLTAVEVERDQARADWTAENYAYQAADARADKAEAEVASLRDQLAAVEVVVPNDCWVLGVPATGPTCTDMIGGGFKNGAKWTEEMCCIPCRSRLALTDPGETLRARDERVWAEGYRAGWDDRHDDEHNPLPAGAQHDTPNPYAKAGESDGE